MPLKWQGDQPPPKTQGSFILERSKLEKNQNQNLWCQKKKYRRAAIHIFMGPKSQKRRPEGVVFWATYVYINIKCSEAETHSARPAPGRPPGTGTGWARPSSRAPPRGRRHNCPNAGVVNCRTWHLASWKKIKPSNATKKGRYKRAIQLND